MTTTSIDLNDLRRRVLSGERVDPATLANAVKQMRNGRMSAATNAKEKKTKQKGASQAEVDDIFAKLGL